MFPSKENVISSAATVTPSTPEASSPKIIGDNDHDKSPAQELRSNIIDPVAMQLEAQKDQQSESKSKTHEQTKSLTQDPIEPSSDNSSVDAYPKTELIRNVSGSLSDVKSSEDMSLLARPIPRRVSLQPKKESTNH